MMSESEPSSGNSRVIEEINLAEDDEVECLEDVMTLDMTEENDMVVPDDEAHQDVNDDEEDDDEPDQDIVDITPPPEV